MIFVTSGGTWRRARSWRRRTSSRPRRRPPGGSFWTTRGGSGALAPGAGEPSSSSRPGWRARWCTFGCSGIRPSATRTLVLLSVTVELILSECAEAGSYNPTHFRLGHLGSASTVERWRNLIKDHNEVMLFMMMVMMMMMMMMIRKKMARKLARRYRWRLGKSRSWEDTDRGQRLLRLLRLSTIHCNCTVLPLIWCHSLIIHRNVVTTNIMRSMTSNSDSGDDQWARLDSPTDSLSASWAGTKTHSTLSGLNKIKNEHNQGWFSGHWIV